MGEQTGTSLKHRSAACKFPSESIRKKQLLRLQGIKKSLNLNLTFETIFVVMSLIIILISGLLHIYFAPVHPSYWYTDWYKPGELFIPEGFPIIMFVQIIMLGVIWKWVQYVREFNKTKATSTLVGGERIVE